MRGGVCSGLCTVLTTERVCLTAANCLQTALGSQQDRPMVSGDVKVWNQDFEPQSLVSLVPAHATALAPGLAHLVHLFIMMHHTNRRAFAQLAMLDTSGQCDKGAVGPNTSNAVFTIIEMDNGRRATASLDQIVKVWG